jgi:hypothetical protein
VFQSDSNQKKKKSPTAGQSGPVAAKLLRRRRVKPMSGFDGLSRRSFSEGGSLTLPPFYLQMLYNESLVQ